MPYVVGTYRDKIGTMHTLLSGEKLSKAWCGQSIRWQVGADQTGVRCIQHPGGDSYRTAWHTVEPLPAALMCKCTLCGDEMRIARGAFTWEAYHSVAREIWGDAIPLTVAEMRLQCAGDK